MDNNNKNEKTLGFFRSQARSLLLANFFVNPDQEFYIRELERKLKIPASNVSREIRKIEASGLIFSRPVGNLVMYKVNKESPLFSQLYEFVTKNLGIQEFLKPYFEKQEDVEFSFIYGSYARGKFDLNSDIDVFIVIKKNCKLYEKLNGKLNEFEKMFGREINADILTLEEYNEKKSRQDPYISDIIENPKIFIKGEESDI